MEIIPNIKNSKNLREEKQKEGELILSQLSNSDVVILLDENENRWIPFLFKIIYKNI